MNEIKIKNVNETIYNFKSKSGLEVYVWNYELSKEINATLTVKCGGIHTDFKVDNKEYHVPSGIAHLVEHLKFNVDKDTTAHDIFNNLGSYTNAYTTYDHTSYIIEFTDELRENLTNLLRFVLNPYFTKKLINKEKPIVTEEAKSVFDNPYNIGYFTLQANVYKNSKYKNLVVGTKEDIKQITLDDILNLYNSYYHPENMFLTITGNVNPYEVEKIVNEYFEDKSYPEFIQPELIIKNEPAAVNVKEDSIFSNVAAEKLLMAFKYKKEDIIKDNKIINIENYIDMSLWNNFGMSSELRYELTSKSLIDTMYYSIEKSENNIVIYFEISTPYPEEIKKIIINKMDNLEINEAALSRRKKVLLATAILGYDSPSIINSKIRYNLIEYGKIIDNVKKIYQNITLENILNINKKLKKYSNSNLILKPSLNEK